MSPSWVKPPRAWKSSRNRITNAHVWALYIKPIKNLVPLPTLFKALNGELKNIKRDPIKCKGFNHPLSYTNADKNEMTKCQNI